MMPTRERVERKLERSGRITPREVLEAYEETGLRPLVGQWYEPETSSACALSAVAVVTDGVVANQDTMMDGQAAINLVVMRVPRMSTYYRMGFVLGFDDKPPPLPSGEDDPAYLKTEAWARKGYRDGQRARRFVFGSGRTEETDRG